MYIFVYAVDHFDAYEVICTYEIFGLCHEGLMFFFDGVLVSCFLGLIFFCNCTICFSLYLVRWNCCI